MKKSLGHRLSLALVLAGLLSVLSATSASASTGFESEFKNSTHSATLSAPATNLTLTLPTIGSFYCTGASYSATTNMPASVAISFPASDLKCSFLDNLHMNGCGFTLAPEGTFGIGPPSCGGITWMGCEIPAQTGLGAKYENAGSGTSRSVQVSLMAVPKVTCNGGPLETGTIAGSWNLKVQTGAGVAKGLWVSNGLSVPRLCKTSGEACAAENLYPAETWLQASASSASIYSMILGKEFAIAKCSSSSLEALPGVSMTSWSLSGCTSQGNSCSPMTNGRVASSFTQTTGNNGTLGASGSWNLICGEANCVYTVPQGSSLDISAGSPASLIANKEPMTGSGTYCFVAEPKFSSTYTINSPKPLYVVTG